MKNYLLYGLPLSRALFNLQSFVEQTETESGNWVKEANSVIRNLLCYIPFKTPSVLGFHIFKM